MSSKESLVIEPGIAGGGRERNKSKKDNIRTNQLNKFRRRFGFNRSVCMKSVVLEFVLGIER